MPASYVNKGAFASANRAINPGIPSGYTVGNLFLLLVETANEAITITPASDWNEVSSSPQFTGSAGSAGGVRLGVYWRIATASESSPTIEDSGDHQSAIIIEFTEVDSLNPIQAIAGNVLSSAGTTITLPSVTTASANQCIVLCLANDRDTNSTSNLSNWTNGNLSSITLRHDQTISTGVGGGVGIATALKATAGATGTTTVTNAASATAAMITIALRPLGAIRSILSNSSSHTASMSGRAKLNTTVYSGLPYSKTPKYGMQYNWFAAHDAKKISSSDDWTVPTAEELVDQFYIDIYPNTGDKLKEVGTTYWNAGGTATNALKFNGRGAGFRNGNGNFSSFRYNTQFVGRELGVGQTISSTHFNEGTVMALGLANTNSEISVWTYLSSADPNVNGQNTGYSVRLQKKTSSLSAGQEGTYTGNDGQVYRTIAFGNPVVEYLADNLCETKFRDGSPIPLVLLDSAWGTNTDSACCYSNGDINNVYAIEYQESVTGLLQSFSHLSAIINSGARYDTQKTIFFGALYNGWAAVDSRNIANTGWAVPSLSEYLTFASFLGGQDYAGDKLKEVGTTYWGLGNNGTNEVGFNLRGTGYRTEVGVYTSLTYMTALWSSSWYIQDIALTVMNSGYNNSRFYYSGGGSTVKMGLPIRLRKDSTSLSNGQSGTYTGNDGTVYRTICINGVEWLADNLVETKYRNGDWITGFDGGVYTPISNSSWAALTSEAMYYPDDSVSNAFFYSDDSAIATLTLHSDTTALVSEILAQSGITATLTGMARLQGNSDGSTTLFAEIYDASGTSFIPVITFF